MGCIKSKSKKEVPVESEDIPERPKAHPDRRHITLIADHDRPISIKSYASLTPPATPETKRDQEYDYRLYQNGERYPNAKFIPPANYQTVVFGGKGTQTNSNSENTENPEDEYGPSRTVYKPQAATIFERKKRPPPSIQMTRLVPVYDGHSTEKGEPLGLQLVHSTSDTPIPPVQSSYSYAIPANTAEYRYV